jgi:hypothetical protein
MWFPASLAVENWLAVAVVGLSYRERNQPPQSIDPGVGLMYFAF